MSSFVPSNFGSTLDPLDTGRGTTIGTFSASVPTGSGLRGSGVVPGASGTSRGKFAMPGTLTVPPVSPKPKPKTTPKIVQKALPKAAVIPGKTGVTAPRAVTPTGTRAIAPRGGVPKTFVPSRAVLPSGRGAGAGAGGDTGAGAGGSTAPSWTTTTYVNDILAISGWTGPSNYYPGVTYMVGTTTLDGLTAPVIATTTSGGAPAQSLPTSADWLNVASLVLAAKQAADAGIAPPTTGGGTITVTNMPTGGGGYDIWGGGSSLPPESAQALVDAAATPTELVTEDVDEMTVSEDVEAPAEEGFFAKYKWWLAGGVGAVGVYAYMHRMDPSKYPLPEAISKLVRK